MSTTGEAHFDLDGTHGYHVAFEVKDRGDDRSGVVVKVFQGSYDDFSFPTPSATYKAHVPVAVKQRSLSFKLPQGLGSAALKLDPKTVDGVGGRSCTSRTFREGILSGQLDFNGEDRFTEIHDTDVGGSITFTRTRQPCRNPRQAPIQPLERRKDGRVLLSSCGEGANFVALTSFHSHRAFYLANQVEHSPKLDVTRVVFSQGRQAGANVASNGKSATVRPPRPYEGTGKFKGGRLTGDLTVSFPGAEDVPLRSTRAHIRTGGVRIPRCFSPLF